MAESGMVYKTKDGKEWVIGKNECIADVFDRKNVTPEQKDQYLKEYKGE